MNRPAGRCEARCASSRRRGFRSSGASVRTSLSSQRPGTESLAIYAEVFTRRCLTELAWYGFSDRLSLAHAFLREAGLLQDETVGETLEVAFAELAKHHPVEYVFKSLALQKLLFGRHSPRTTAFYTEFPVGECRADFLLANGDAVVYEIKTPMDDLNRLSSQLSSYYQCFSNVILLTDQSKLLEAMEELPSHVGISVLTNRGHISTVRPPASFSGALKHASLFALLRKPEYVRLGEDLGLDTDRLHPAKLFDSCLECFRKLGIEEAQQTVIKTLKGRQKTETIAALSQRLPRSLRLAAFSFRLRKADWDAIIALQEIPLGVRSP